MEKKADRPCPLCGGATGEVLNTQAFVLPEGHPLARGYDVVCCGRCGFVYADTTVTQAEYERFYAESSKYEDDGTATGGGGVPWDEERLGDMARWLSVRVADREARILDVGCANGGLLRHFQELGYRRVAGVDPAAACVVHTRRLGIEARQGALGSVPAELGKFDLVTVSHVLEHVQDLRGAVAALIPLLAEGGVVYVETPDAMRYAEMLLAPFQDFNTEHINHFSPGMLDQFMGHAGFRRVAGGTKTLSLGAGQSYPALFGLYALERRAGAAGWERDVRLRAAVEEYITRSRRMWTEMAERLEGLAAGGQPMIVWGTGELVMKLLAQTALARANIAMFVDGNPIHHGRVLGGVTIQAPAQLKQVPADWPILVGTLLHDREIVARVRNELKLANPIVLLRDRDAGG